MSQQLTIAEGEAQMVTLLLQSSVAKPAATAPSDAPAPARADSGGGVSAKALVVIGGGVLSLAAVGVGVAFTVKSNAAGKDADALFAQIVAGSDPGLGTTNS